MMARERKCGGESGGGVRDRAPSALFVTTVSITLEAFLTPFAAHFRSQGWRVDAMANGAESNTHIADQFDRRFDIEWSRRPFDPRGMVNALKTVKRVAADGRYDIVHVHTPVAAFLTRLMLSRLPAPCRPVVIYTAHGFHFYPDGSYIRDIIFRSAEGLAARWTDYLVTVNQTDFAAATRFSGIPAERVRLIPGVGVDLEEFSPTAATPVERASIRNELDVPGHAFMLTMIAELAPVKRHAYLLEAFTRVSDETVVLVLVGSGPLEAALRRKARDLGIEDRIRWAGYRRDIPKLLSASDALILVSEREGLPRAVLEAMACGRAVIGTATRGIVDAVGDVAGWIVDKHDKDRLAQVIDHAASNPDELYLTGMAARERSSEFALARVIHEYEELYREALSSAV